MSKKLIPAKPFILQFRRLEIEMFEKRTADKAAMGAAWMMVLNKPFNPEEIPDILEGWFSNGDSFITVMIDEKQTVQYKNSAITVWPEDTREMAKLHNLTGKPQTLNDFLSDLHRAGIEAHFREEWIKERGLM